MVLSNINWKFLTVELLPSLRTALKLISCLSVLIKTVFTVITPSNFASWFLLNLCSLLLPWWNWTSKPSLLSFLPLFPKWQLPLFLRLFLYTKLIYLSLYTLSYLTHKFAFLKSIESDFIYCLLTMRLFWLTLAHSTSYQWNS